jgi:segregation and condensation protein B
MSDVDISTVGGLGLSLDAPDLELVLEAVLFAASEPVAMKDLLAACALEDEAAGRAAVEAALDRLSAHYRERSIELARSAGGYRFRVRQQFSVQVQAAQPERPQRLSRALLETLAIIAYRQPVTRAEIEEIRGVAVSTQIMRTLTERGWVHVVGHKEVPGRPGLYATTRVFLDDLGLGRLDELPPLDALRELVDLPGDDAGNPPRRDADSGDEDSGRAPASDD